MACSKGLKLINIFPPPKIKPYLLQIVPNNYFISNYEGQWRAGTIVSRQLHFKIKTYIQYKCYVYDNNNSKYFKPKLKSN